jgi:chemosensory pili system protein ChpA (sensor histidine kinase/response regulator)
MLSEQQQRIMGYFIEEAKDHLNTIEQGLLNLQATIADPEMVNEVFRAAHSVKGGAAMLGLTSIQNTSHRLEDYFKVLKECPIQIDQKLETLLLRVYDTLQELLEQLQGPFGLTDDKAEEAMAAVEPTFTQLNQHLSQLVSQAGVQTPEDVDLAVTTPTPATVSQPAPVRATTEESALRFIFQNDVPARLREMLQLFKQTDTPETRQQLQALCQILAQPGEQLDLPDWCQLLNTTERAITHPDNTYRTLAPVVIKEIKRAQEQILAGSGTQITASADLLALVPPEPIPTVAEVTGLDLADVLGSADGISDGFDPFSEEATPSELTAAERGDSSEGFLDFPAAEAAPFEMNEPEFELSFDALGAEENGDSIPDLSFDQFDEAIPTLYNHQAGPEVGVAELNSLADLFEGEDSDLGLAWQEEVIDESGENEPEILEIDDTSSDFSDLLFQDSDALQPDAPEEDLSGLLNRTTQQLDEAANSDVFGFGELTDIHLEDSLAGLESANPDQAVGSDLNFLDLPLTEPTFSQPAEPNFEAALFGPEASEPADFDTLFAEVASDQVEEDEQSSVPLNGLFADEEPVRESSIGGDLTDGSNFDIELDANLEQELNGEFDREFDAVIAPELPADEELDVFSLSDLDDLDLSAPADADLDLLGLDSEINSELDLELDMASLDGAGSARTEDGSELLSEPLDADGISSPELDLDALGFSESFDAVASSPEADVRVWRPAIADPWNESLADAQLDATRVADATTDAVRLEELEPTGGDLFTLEAESAPVSSEADWIDLDLSESVEPLDFLGSEASAEPELTVVEPIVEPIEQFGVEPSDSPELSDELNSAELNFQAMDSSTLEVLNQPSLELTADEAADLDFNFDEAAFDETAFDASATTPAETSSAFALPTDDAAALDLEVGELSAAVDPEADVDFEAEEVPFHFGAVADATTANNAVGLDDLLDESDAGVELDLFEASVAEPNLAASLLDADLSLDLSLDPSLDEEFDLGSGDNADDANQDVSAVDLQGDASGFDLFGLDNLDNSDDLPNSDMDALLLSEPLLQDAVVGADLGDLSPLDASSLDLDEFALPDDFSELDSTIPSGITDAPEANAEEMIAEETIDLAELSELSMADDLSMAEPTAPSLEATGSEAILDLDAVFVEAPLPDTVDAPMFDSSLDDEALESLSAPESESEPPAVAEDFGAFNLFEVEEVEVIATPLQAVERDLDQSSDMGQFELEFSSEAQVASEMLFTSEADLQRDDLLDASFDLFATEDADSSAPIDILDPGLADDLDLETELIVPEDTPNDLNWVEAPNLEGLETDDFATITDASTEQALDAAFSVEGVEAENLLEFVLDAQIDAASEADWAEIGLGSTETAPEAANMSPAEQADQAFDDLFSRELSDEPSADLSLGFELAAPEAEAIELSEIDVGWLRDEISNETDNLDLNIAESAILSSELDFDPDLSSFDSGDVDLSDVDLDIDLADGTGADELFNAVLADEASGDSVDLPEIEPLEMTAPEATSAPDLPDDFDSADLNLALDSTLDPINFDADSSNGLTEQAAIAFDSELDSVNLDWDADLNLDAETASPTGLIAEGDLNDLDLDGLLQETAASTELSWAEDMAIDVEIPDAVESFDSSPDQTEFGDLEAMLAESGSVELGAVSAEPAEFDDLEAMLAEPLPITAIHIEEDLVETEEMTTASDASYDASNLEADEFADLEALLDDSSEAELVEPAPVASPVEVDDEFSDLEALLQDADQALGVGSSSTRKPSTTANRRPSRRSGLNEQTMRVSVKHLDNLNNLVGEMVVNRNSLEQAEERLRQFLDNLLYQVQQLSDVGQRMRDLYERSLLESSLLSGRRGSSSTSISGFGAGGQPNHAAGMNFDALEMDRFTGFHVLSQEMIELIVRVRESASDIDFVVEETDQVTRNFRQITTQLQEGLTRSRMVPFSQTADRLPRGVRDNSLKYGKQAELVIEGRDTLIDKMIVEQLYDPMTHLVNNAIAHGIETPEERIAAGKPPTGKIVIRTFHQGNQTVISVSDDGAGINPEKVRAKALAKGLIDATQAQEMSRLDTYDLLFRHGFSTVDHVDDLRGRGVGLDVVRNNLNEIRGTISIDSTIGKGTTFTIRLPLTLSISKALCCISNRARIAFPMDGVEDMLDVPKERIQTDEQGRPCIQWRDIVLPFQPLSDLLRYNRVLGRGSVYGGNQEEDVISIVVLRSAGNFLALQVDQVLGEQEIVIKQLEGPIPKPIGVAGATVLGDGRIMPIADVLELIDLWQGRIRREAGGLLWDKGEAQLPPEPPAKTESTVLIVDDSITVRELLSMTFSKVGYRVEQARDGQEAWEKLRSGLPCDLVFCDIEMPRMDGLELLSRIQKDSNLSHLPIAMLTSRGADRHRQMAVQLGAKGYFTKPYLEEVLLDAAQRMLKGEVMISGANTQ